MSSNNNQPMDQTTDDNMPTHTKSINTNMPTSMININTNQPPTTISQPPKQPKPTTQQYNLFPEQQQLYILQQELLKQETILSSFKNDSPEHHRTANEELTTWQQSQVNEMNESINVIKRKNEERKQKLFDVDSNSAMGGVSGNNKEEVMLCGTASDLTTNNNNNNNNHNMMNVQQQQQFIPEPLKLPSKRHPISRRGGNVANNGGRLTQSLNNEQQQNYTSYEQRPYSSSFTYGQTPFQYEQQQQQGYGYGGDDLTTIGGMGGGVDGGDTFGRPFHSIDQQQGSTNNPQYTNMKKLFNGQVYMDKMEQYNINNESKMTRRNSIYKPNQSNNIMMSTLLTNTSYTEEVVPTNFFANISKPKKRRLNSNEMLLAMLTDTIVSPGRGSSGDKDKVALPPPPPTPTAGSSIGTQNNGNGRRESTLSPPTNLDKVTIGNVNTPTMFANYFLSNIGIKECKEDEGGDVINTMPPPPLLVGNDSVNKDSGDDVQMKEESKKKKVNQTKERKLPAVVWQPSSNSSPKPTKSIKTTDNQKPSSYIETPSSETINALSNQIKSNLSSSLASSSSSLYQTATNTTTGGDEGSSTMAKTGATQPQFALTMEASQASQQSIHDWDKKFGLRRAHSKTMRESCRSRKRVLDFLKGEGSNLLLLKQQMMERTQHQQGQGDDTILPSLLRASTASTSTISLPLQRGQGEEAVIESAADADIHMQDQEVGMSYEVQQVGRNEQSLLQEEEVQGQEPISLPRQTLLGSTSQSTKKDDQTSDSNEILKTHSHSSSDCSKELEQMFRRASLDCTQVITGLARPVQDSDCKSYIAKSA